jgi:hypothetical protein
LLGYYQIKRAPATTILSWELHGGNSKTGEPYAIVSLSFAAAAAIRRLAVPIPHDIAAIIVSLPPPVKTHISRPPQTMATNPWINKIQTLIDVKALNMDGIL